MAFCPIFSWESKLDDGEFSFQFSRQAQTAAQINQGVVLRLGPLQHVLELADEDRVGILLEEVKIPQQYDGLFLEFLYGDEGLKRIVGGGG